MNTYGAIKLRNVISLLGGHRSSVLNLRIDSGAGLPGLTSWL